MPITLDPTLLPIPAGQVVLSDRRTQRSWTEDVGFRLARNLGRTPK